MEDSQFLADTLIILAAAVAIVPLFRRIGVSAILGYLFAGGLIGPYGLGLIGDPEELRSLAELGVVFLLFCIGLELSLARIWRLRRQVFGLGLMQVTLTALVISLLASVLGVDRGGALVLGGGLALSSTAIVLQMVTERRALATPHGRAATSVLLLQDLAVVPLLTLLPLLGGAQANLGALLGSALLRSVVVLALVLGAARLLLRPLLHGVARGKNPELNTGIALLLVLGIGGLTQVAGLSMALGAFLAGLLIAETEFRPQALSDIAPFRGLLLALFFMTVGMGVDLDLLRARFPLILALTAALIILKACILVGLCLAFGFTGGTATHVGLLLAQGGEFGFLLFAMARELDVLQPEPHQIALLVVGLSMSLTPVLSLAGRAADRRLMRKRAPLEHVADATREVRDHVLIAGFGRVGHTLASLLDAAGVPYVALDLDARTVAKAREADQSVFFGDGSNIEAMKAAGLARARAAVVTLDEPEAADRAVQVLRAADPDLPIVARAHDLRQCARLQRAGATRVVPEIVEGSLQIGASVLALLGQSPAEVGLLLEGFRRDMYVRAESDAPAESAPQPGAG